jgi:bacteriocin biosynthesis cyclodehydratase domain-containing protein
MRPTLLPNLRRLWRDARTIQLGTEPSSAVVIEFADSRAARVLDLLDGTRTALHVVADAQALGVAPAHARQIIDQLRAAGLVVGVHTLLPAGMAEPIRQRLTAEAAALALRRTVARSGERRTPADMLRRRAAARVVVAGTGPLVAPIATALASAGVGHVDPAVDGWVNTTDVLIGGLLPGDANRARAIATVDAVIRAAPGTQTTPVRETGASFVVRVGSRLPKVLAERGFRTHHVPRLDVSVREGVVVVGPLVRPASSPCHACLELHRRDRDPAWPVLAAQLATGRAGEPETCALTTGLAGAAYAVEEVLAYLDGTGYGTDGACVEVWAPGRLRRRAWLPHPRCDCRRRRRTTISA